ncbi:hypothetical protein PT287_02800 [Lactobacillus sp. ESL0679]|nr:hypothetical protein [Lactobacillus sp. ESL0679]MDF7682450.1 hypothetical protein [Lactobacillus sp. ESL0679]
MIMIVAISCIVMVVIFCVCIGGMQGIKPANAKTSNKTNAS